MAGEAVKGPTVVWEAAWMGLVAGQAEEESAGGEEATVWAAREGREAVALERAELERVQAMVDEVAKVAAAWWARAGVTPRAQRHE